MNQETIVALTTIAIAAPSLAALALYLELRSAKWWANHHKENADFWEGQVMKYKEVLMECIEVRK